MATTKSFIDSVNERRSYYLLNDQSPISDDRIVELVNQAIRNVPSSFNSQSTRVVLLLKDEHNKLWDITKEILKTLIPEAAYAATAQKLDGFKAGYGTILFYEDPIPTNKLVEKFPRYAQHFPVWAEHGNAMNQFTLWTALEAEGLGANLQHYNPIIDERVAAEWDVPLGWSFRAQLVFGGRAGPPNERTYEALESRVFVHGK